MRRSRSRGGLLPWAALVLLAAIPYLGSLDGPLLHDDRTLLDNPWLAREAGIASVFQQDYWHGTRHGGSDLYRPLTILTLAWNARGSTTGLGFRATNLLLHAIVTLLVAGVVLRVVERYDPRRKEHARAAAWIAAAIFALHPLASEAVIAAVGRSELLAAALGLAAFLLLPEAESKNEEARLAASCAVFFLALCAKESASAWAALLPALVALAAWAKRKRPTAREARLCVPPLVALVGFGILRTAVIGRAVDTPPWIDNPLVRVGHLTRIANAVVLQGLYLAKMALPARLSVDYGFDQIPTLALAPWGALLAVAILAAWAAVLVVLARRSAAAAFFWTFVPGAFAVTGNFAFPIGAIFGERLAYLPLVGACALAGLGIGSLPLSKTMRGVAVAILLASLGARTVVRTLDYESLVTLNEATAKASPRSVKALANEGRTLLRTGRPRDAIAPLERAIAIWPDYAGALELLSQTYQALGDRARASDYHGRAIEAAARVRGASSESAEPDSSPSSPPALP